MALKLTNNASSTLAGSIDTSSTTLSVQGTDAAKFPSLSDGDWFPVTVVDASGNMEIMKATGRSGAVLTVTRAQEGTAAKAFDPGARVSVRLTAAAAHALMQSAIAASDEKEDLSDDDVFPLLDSDDDLLEKHVTWNTFLSLLDARFARAETGDTTLFYQAAAPTGWTKVTTHNNKALRVVSGTGGGSGGSVAFTTAFASQRSVSGNVANHTLTVSEIPSHPHGAGTLKAASGGAYSPNIDANAGVGFSSGSRYAVGRIQGTETTASGVVQSIPDHTHDITGSTGNAGGGQPHKHNWSGSVNLAVQYVDVIICQKD